MTSAAGARLLHDRDGAFGDERDRHRMGAHAVARRPESWDALKLLGRTA